MKSINFQFVSMYRILENTDEIPGRRHGAVNRAVSGAVNVRHSGGEQRLIGWRAPCEEFDVRFPMHDLLLRCLRNRAPREDEL